MGWLFALALGLQEHRRSAVLAALVPIAIGHAVSVALVGVLLVGAGVAVSPRRLHVAAAAVLIGFGVFRLVRPYAHARWVGMRVGFRDLVLWSFLMASAHGAGLMLAPVFLGLPGPPAHAHAAGGLLVLAVHTGAMLLVMGAVGLAIYQTLGLELLRRAWVNLDLVWAAALIAVGMAMLVTG